MPMNELFSTLWPVLVAFTYAGGVALALLAISQERSSQGAVAWAVALVTMPFLAIPFFALFGGWRFTGYVRRFREKLAEHRIEIGQLPDSSRLGASELGAMQVVEELARFPFTRGNKIELLVDAQATYDALFKAIDEARETVLIQFYIINDDEAGRIFAEHLVSAAGRGVEVCLLYDEIGSHATPSRYFEQLTRAGVNVSSFGSATRPGKRFQINFRNHRKVAVIDGRIAFTGGLNIGDEYLGKSPWFGNWRDTHVRFRGPAVRAAQFSFLEDWHWATGEQLDSLLKETTNAKGGQTALFAATGPADRVNTFELLLVQAVNSATRSIHIATPYFVPDEQVMTALQLAVMRGVKVSLLVPRKNDNWLVGLANHAWVDSALNCGVSAFHYADGFMHQKVVLIDDRLASVGSANIDNRSFCLNFEATLLVADVGFAQEVGRMLEADFRRSVQLEAGYLERKSVFFRLLVRIARLTSPLL